MPVEDVAGAIELIKAWMTQREISEGIKTEPNPSGFSFHFTGKSERDVPFTVLQPETWKRTVVILSEVTIAEEHIESIKSMGSRNRDKFFGELQKEMFQLPTGFAFAPDVAENGFSTGIQFSQEICYDGLTEDRLNGAVRNVLKSVAFVIWLIRTEFAVETPMKE